MMTTRKQHVLQTLTAASSVGFMFAGLASAQVTSIPITGSGFTYTQDFDTLANSPEDGKGTWNNFVTLTGWHARAQGAVITDYTIDDGSLDGFIENVPGNNGFFSYGAEGSTERAFGMWPDSSGFTPGVNQIAAMLVLQNTSGAALDGSLLNVEYDVELWRARNDPKTDDVLFYYYIFSDEVPVGSLAPNGSGDAFPALDGAPPEAAEEGPVDGNAVFTTVSSALDGVTVEDGQFLVLKWRAFNGDGDEAGVAIDNVTVTYDATTEPTADINGDGQITIADLIAYIQLFRSATPDADFNGDDNVTIADLIAFIQAFRAG